MKILGLTGSIGMGKSTAAAMLRRMGWPVHDADATVHRLMGKGGKAVAAIEAAFPGVAPQGMVSRPELGRRVFGDVAALRRLEAIIHPLVRAEELAFLRRHARRRTALVVLDIPLLFETGGAARCDKVVTLSCPAFLQAQRVLARPGMGMDRLRAILAQQMADGQKRKRADFVVFSGCGKALTWRTLRRVAAQVLKQSGPGVWPPRPKPRFGHA